MTGWLIMFALAALSAFLLVRWSGLGRGGWQMIAAALVLAMAGYAWQGNPQLWGAAPAKDQAAAATNGSVRRFVSARFGPVAETIGYSDAWLRAGRPDLAARVIQIGLKTNPNSADLWLALGGTLTQASGGTIAPPARFAFDRAAKLAPEHPGVLFHQGLAAAQADDLPTAVRLWLRLYENSPEDAPWREDLGARLSAIAAMVAESKSGKN
jgi:cytochrome c-type biogenesis protein CcmH